MPRQFPKNDTLNAPTEKQVADWLSDASAFIKSFNGLYNNSYRIIVAEYMAAQEGFTLRKECTDKPHPKNGCKIGDKVHIRADSTSYQKFYSCQNALFRISGIVKDDGAVPAVMLTCINQKKVPELCVPVEHLDFYRY